MLRTLQANGVPWAWLLVGLALGGCSQAGCKGAVTAELFFGLSMPGGVVSPAAFTAFLDRNVTPRFPAGLTVLDGDGRWRAPDGRMTREASKLVLIVAPRGVETMERLQAIRAEYREAFQQQSVGLVLVEGCADF